MVLRLIGCLVLVMSHASFSQDAAQIARAYHQAETARIVSDFRAFLSLPNVAANYADMQVNAEFIQRYIAKRGFSSKVISAGGAPYVIAERLGAEGAPSVLIYAHFDGQPVIPSQWSSPPFEPTL